MRHRIIELLYFDGWPSQQGTPRPLERVAAHSGAELRLQRVETLEAAEPERFLGSPTVRVNDVDVDPTAAERDDFAIKCRIYRCADGVSPLPPGTLDPSGPEVAPAACPRAYDDWRARLTLASPQTHHLEAGRLGDASPAGRCNRGH